jgi:hypothetical protein
MKERKYKRMISNLACLKFTGPGIFHIKVSLKTVPAIDLTENIPAWL